jgi:hypothetical protein
MDQDIEIVCLTNLTKFSSPAKNLRERLFVYAVCYEGKQGSRSLLANFLKGACDPSI